MITETVSLKEKIGYGFGDAASSMFWKLFSMYLLFFYTDIFSIPAAVVGTMFLVTRIWDSAFDPIVGIIADRTNSRWGKFRPYLLWCAIPFGIAGVLTFTTPDMVIKNRIIYAYVSYSVMMMVYSLINVPYASLLGVISSNTKVRTTLSSFRMVFAFLGSILALTLINPFVDFFSNYLKVKEQQSWQFAIFVFAVIAVILFWLSFSWTRERIMPINKGKNRLSVDINDLFKDRPWWILLGSGISALIFNSIRDGAAIYYFKYFIQNKNLISYYLVLGQAFNIVGIIFVTPLSHKFGKRATYLSAMIMASTLSIVFYFLNKDSIALILIFQCLISICAGSIFPLLWSMYADIADYSEYKTGRRATGLIFSSSSMSQKFGWTIGGALTGWLLGHYGYHANELQSAETQSGIRMMLSIFPAIGTILSVIFIFIYPLNEKLMFTINEKLEKQRTPIQN